MKVKKIKNKTNREERIDIFGLSMFNNNPDNENLVV
jgi:hypothetical protein